MDVIRVRDLRVKTRVGVPDEERAEPQNVSIDLEIEADLGPAGGSDDLADTIDYAAVVEDVAELVQTSEVRLLETLAQRIAARILTNDRVRRVTVEVAKPVPPIDEDVGPVSVRVMRP